MTHEAVMQKKLIARDDSRSYMYLAALIVSLYIVMATGAAHAQSDISLPDGCNTLVDADAGSGRIQEIKLICKPQQWKGDLVVYAHGYIPPAEDIQIPDDTILAVQLLVPLLLENGAAFAATSYRKNGFAVEQAEKDINALVDSFPGDPDTVLLVGGSEGALITTALIEKYRDRYDGGVAFCGPLAGTGYAVQYFVDARVIFDYLFPTHPGDGLPVFFTDPNRPVESRFGAIPPQKGDQFWQENWESGIKYKDRIEETILDDLNNNDGERTQQLFNIVRIALPDPDEPDYADSVAASVSGILSYVIRGFNDLYATAGGNPYGNKRKWYWGSDNDWLLNLRVERVAADRGARAYISEFYTPSGNLPAPLVATHTLHDPFVPFRNEFIYAVKAFFNGSLDRLRFIPVDRFGHCSFEDEEVLGSFGLLLSQLGIPLPNTLEINRALLPEVK